MPEHPTKKVFTVAQATDLASGKYYEENEPEDELAALDMKEKQNQNVYIGRDNLESDLKLEEFE